MSRDQYIVVMKRVGYVKVLAGSPSHAMEIADAIVKEEDLKHLSKGYKADSAILADDVPGLAKFCSEAQVKSDLRETSTVRGRPKMTVARIPESFVRHYDLYKSGKITCTDFARQCGISRPTVYKYAKLVEGLREQNRHKEDEIACMEVQEEK